MYINTVGYYMGNIGMAGNPSPFSVTPVLFGTYTDQMNFIQRVHNFALSLLVTVLQQVMGIKRDRGRTRFNQYDGK